MKNAAGNFVDPTLKTVSAAGRRHSDPNDDMDFRVSITNAEGAEAYPISSLTWLLVRKQPADTAKHAKLKEFLTWMLTPRRSAWQRTCITRRFQSS